MTSELHRVLLDHGVELVRPLTASAESPAAVRRLLDAVGWDLDAIAGISVGELETALRDSRAAVDEVLATLADGPQDLWGLASALVALGKSTARVVAVTKSWNPPVGLPPTTFETFAGDLLGFLLDTHLNQRFPRVRALLLVTGVLAETAQPAIARPDGKVVRRARIRPELDVAVLGRALSDPAGLLRDRFAMDGQARRAAEAIADLAGPIAADALRQTGLAAWYGMPAGATDPRLTTLERQAAGRLLHAALIYQPDPPSGDVGVLAAALSLVDRANSLALVAVPYGSLAISREVNGWILAASLAGEPQPLVISRDGVEFEGTAQPHLALNASARRAPAAEPMVRFGGATGTRFELDGVEARIALDARPARFDVAVGVELQGARFAIAAGDGDGFLSLVLPKEPLVLDLGLAADWSPKGGLKIRGSAGLEAVFALHAVFGPIHVDTLAVALRATEKGATLELAASAGLKLGPIAAAVERLGVSGRLGDAPTGGSFGPVDLNVAFRPPDGVGLAVDAGPVTGGGYLFFDPDREQYAGVLQLEFSAIALKAVGLLTTRMPDGSPGFSLLVIISAEFTPIQLGFGFTLSGVGGLLGINRTAAVEPLRAGLRNRTLDSILFPKDPVANAPKLISDLGMTFPVAVGRHVFGPMARINWGTPALITLELGLVLELPAPVRLLILGRLRMALPREEAAIVRINMDVLGVIDFGRGEASIDATLYDSTVAGFTLTGDMAMRMSWRENPGFALSAGGFHPRFQPPPGFPALRRLTLALATGDNPRLRLETYLALTSNTAQIGARLELYAAAAGFSVEGLLYFDALFRFDPFSFVVDMGGSLALKQGSRTLMGVSVDVTLSGPNPWHAAGRATFSILGFKASVGFDTTFGERRPEALPPPVDVGALVDAALSDPRNWSAQLPAGGTSILTLRDIRPATGELLAHPLGTLTVAQRVVPFGVPLERYGTSRLAAGSDSVFNVTKLRIDAATPDSTPIEDVFAPAQFRDLTDDEKLSAPSFQRHEAGRRLASAAITFDTTTLVPMALEYETAIIDAPDAPAREAAVALMDAPTLLLRSAAGPAAFAPARATGPDRFAAEGLELGVAG